MTVTMFCLASLYDLIVSGMYGALKCCKVKSPDQIVGSPCGPGSFKGRVLGL